ncbi:multicopper oxidase domain-containing protein [Arenicella sp. 4NH20-0111]
MIRWKEGDTITVNVKNNMEVDSSIHWLGMFREVRIS